MRLGFPRRLLPESLAIQLALHLMANAGLIHTQPTVSSAPFWLETSITVMTLPLHYHLQHAACLAKVLGNPESGVQVQRHCVGRAAVATPLATTNGQQSDASRGGATKRGEIVTIALVPAGSTPLHYPPTLPASGTPNRTLQAHELLSKPEHIISTCQSSLLPVYPKQVHLLQP